MVDPAMLLSIKGQGDSSNGAACQVEPQMSAVAVNKVIFTISHFPFSLSKESEVKFQGNKGVFGLCV